MMTWSIGTGLLTLIKLVYFDALPKNDIIYIMAPRRNPDLDENSAGTHVAVSNTTGNGVAPQITSTIGVPEPAPEIVEATGAVGAVTNLNPNGPINRMSEGGIVFGYPDLIYSQFIDIDQQIEVTDDMSPNSLVLQIPYHPISEYTNAYIQSYAKMHNRYNGDIIFRAQIIGNATFSGTIMWFWWPRKYPSNIVSMADAMKYSYKSQSIQMNSVEEILHHDARKYQYYRDMDEQDIDSRPHLCLMVHTTVESPLREGVKIRIRIGSRLASASIADRAKMASPFMFADPVPLPISGGSGGTGLNGKKMSDILPHFITSTFRMATDGTTSASYTLVDSSRHGYNFSYRGGIPGITGKRVSGANDPSYLYTSTDVVDNKIHILYCIHQLPPYYVLTLSSDSSFRNFNETNAKDIATQVPFIKDHLTVYATRTLSASLAVSDGISLETQTTCYTSKGKMVVCYVLVDTTIAKDLYALGFSNIAGGTTLSYPHSDVLGPTNYTNGLVKLPGNWTALKFSDEDPSIINSASDIAPSIFSDVATLELFKNLTSNLVEDQVLQFDLVDSIALIRIATVRFIPGRQEFVINPSDNIKYRQYAGDLNSLIFANYGVQPQAANFPLTDTTTWLSRLPASSLRVASEHLSNPLNRFILDGEHVHGHVPTA